MSFCIRRSIIGIVELSKFLRFRFCLRVDLLEDGRLIHSASNPSDDGCVILYCLDVRILWRECLEVLCVTVGALAVSTLWVLKSKEGKVRG